MGGDGDGGGEDGDDGEGEEGGGGDRGDDHRPGVYRSRVGGARGGHDGGHDGVHHGDGDHDGAHHDDDGGLQANDAFPCLKREMYVSVREGIVMDYR